MQTLEEIIFLLGDSGLDHVTSQDVLHALDTSLMETNKFMPKGSTGADAWIARHGLPLSDLDATFEMAHMIGESIRITLNVGTYGATAHIIYFLPNRITIDGKGEYRQDTGYKMGPIVLTLAILDATNKIRKMV